MADNNALNLVDQLLNNEKADKPKPKQKKVFIKKKAPIGPGDFKGNTAFDPSIKQEYWPGDTISISKEMLKEAHLPSDAFLVSGQIPSFYTEAMVYCPWYSIHGWGASTRAAMDNCIKNIADYWENFPEAAKALSEGFKDYTPRRKVLKSLLKKEDVNTADILMDEGL